MYTGGLNHAITIERKIQMGVTAQNAPIYVWQIFVEPFAEMTSRRGREHFDPRTTQRYSEVIYHFRCHYDDVVGVNETMRVVDEDDQIYDIKAILPDANERQDCIIECTLQDGTLGDGALAGYIDEAINDGEVGEAYVGFTVRATGGTSPYTFSVFSGALPAGLALNSSSGAVTGTPTGAGDSDVVFRITDAADDTFDLPELTITVA